MLLHFVPLTHSLVQVPKFQSVNVCLPGERRKMYDVEQTIEKFATYKANCI